MIYLIIAVNNNHKTLLYMNETKKRALTHFKEEIYREKLNAYFSDIMSCINANIYILLDSVVDLIFREIKKALFSKLFK